MVPETEVRALIERLGRVHRRLARLGLVIEEPINPDGPDAIATLEALLAERDANTAVNLATVSAYEAGVLDGASAERDRVVAWLRSQPDNDIHRCPHGSTGPCSVCGDQG